MLLESVETVYHDGGHNAFTDIVQWRGKYWVCFRNAASHRSIGGRICVVSSPDLRNWSTPAVPIDTPEDNRDPKLFVFDDRLHLTSMTVTRSSERPGSRSGGARTEAFFSLSSHTADGVHWSDPRPVWDPFKGIWWAEAHGGRMYGSGYVCRPVDGAGHLLPGSSKCEMNSSEFVTSVDGLDWKTLSVISRQRQPTECALAFLADGRAVGFLRHNLEESPFPEILTASPPYNRWENVYDFPYCTNGPCLGLVGDTLVAASRAFLDWESTPAAVSHLAEPEAVRGLLVMTVDVDGGQVVPELVISCPPHPAGDWPDVAYAGIVDLGGGGFAMSYYQGLKAAWSDIKVARLRL